MKKTILLFLALIAFNAQSQKLKLRIDVGNSIGYCSFKYKMISKFYQKPIQTSEYTIDKSANISLFSLPIKIGLLLEYDLDKRNHLSFGYFAAESSTLKYQVLYNYGPYGIDSLGYRDVRPWGQLGTIETYLHKINFTFSRDYGSKRVKISPFVGLSYAWFMYNPKPYDTIAQAIDGPMQDDMFPNSKLKIVSTMTGWEHTNSLMLSLGSSIKFYSKKRELFALKMYYEQGFNILSVAKVEVYRNNNHFYNYVYSRGSAFYIKVSVPIQLYDFEKHKKK